MKRRDVLAGVGGLAVVGMAGCLGVAGLDEHEASPAGVDESVRADTGYEQVGIEEFIIEERFEAGSIEEDIRVTNYQTEHEKAVDLGPLGSQRAAVFVVLTTPQISIAGQELNPIEEMDTEELVDLVADNYDEMGAPEHDTDEEITVLSQETMKSRFEADAQFDGEDLEVFLHIIESVETSEDHLVGIGVYPKEVQSEEEPNIVALMENVVEEVDGTPEEGVEAESGADGEDEDEDADGESDTGDSDEDDDTDDDDGVVNY